MLPAQNNFADLREESNKIMGPAPDENMKRLAEIVGMLAYRCDLLERGIERLERAAGPKAG